MSGVRVVGCGQRVSKRSRVVETDMERERKREAELDSVPMRPCRAGV